MLHSIVEHNVDLEDVFMKSVHHPFKLRAYRELYFYFSTDVNFLWFSPSSSLISGQAVGECLP